MSGIDPNREWFESARITAPAVHFVDGVAEALPFPSASFDGVIFVNSLHHIAVRQMTTALSEAMRVVHDHGFVVVIEPLTEGNYFSILRLIDDETQVRRMAQSTIAEGARQGAFHIAQTFHYVRRQSFADSMEFLTHAAAVDPARAAVVNQRRAELERAFLEMGHLAQDGRTIFDQPIRAHVLRPRA